MSHTKRYSLRVAPLQQCRQNYVVRTVSGIRIIIEQHMRRCRSRPRSRCDLYGSLGWGNCALTLGGWRLECSDAPSRPPYRCRRGVSVHGTGCLSVCRAPASSGVGRRLMDAVAIWIWRSDRYRSVGRFQTRARGGGSSHENWGCYAVQPLRSSSLLINHETSHIRSPSGSNNWEKWAS